MAPFPHWRSAAAAQGALALLLFAQLGCQTAQSSHRAGPVQPPAPATDSAAARRSADQLFSAGKAAYQSGRYDEARLLFTEALELSPGMAGAQYNLGVIAERQGDRSKAASAYEAALRSDPRHLPAILNLARIRLLDGQSDSAVTLLESGMQQSDEKNELTLMNNLATAYRLAKKYAKAETTSRAVLSKYGDDVDALKNLALVYYEQGRLHLAELVETSAAKLNPNDPAVHNDLGLIYLKLGRRIQAVAEFRRAIALDSKFSVAHRNLGALALEYRDYPTAEKSFSALASLEPASCEARLYYAQALEGQRPRDPSKASAAGAQYEEALAIQRDNGEAICGAGRIYSYDKENWSKALRYLERCKGLPSTSARERSQIESREQALIALSHSSASEGAPTAAPQAEPPVSAGEEGTAESEQRAAEGAPQDVPPGGQEVK